MMKFWTVMLKWRRWPTFILWPRKSNRLEGSMTFRKMKRCFERSALGRRIHIWIERYQIFERSGSKDTRYLWESSKDIFQPYPSFNKVWSARKIKLVKSFVDQFIFRLRWLTFIDFHWPSDLSRAIASSKDQISTNTLDFWEFPIQTLQKFRGFQNWPFWKIVRYEVLQRLVLWSISACQVSDRAPTSVNQK